MGLISKAIKAGLVAKLASYAFEKYSQSSHPVQQAEAAAKRTWYGRAKPQPQQYGASEVVADLMAIAQKLRRG